MISSFKSQRTMLLFQKAYRWCVMSITDYHDEKPY
jgi:hypothetical protein